MSFGNTLKPASCQKQKICADLLVLCSAAWWPDSTNRSSTCRAMHVDDTTNRDVSELPSPLGQRPPSLPECLALWLMADLGAMTTTRLRNGCRVSLCTRSSGFTGFFAKIALASFRPQAADHRLFVCSWAHVTSGFVVHLQVAAGLKARSRG